MKNKRVQYSKDTRRALHARLKELVLTGMPRKTMTEKLAAEGWKTPDGQPLSEQVVNSQIFAYRLNRLNMDQKTVVALREALERKLLAQRKLTLDVYPDGNEAMNAINAGLADAVEFVRQHERVVLVDDQPL